MVGGVIILVIINCLSKYNFFYAFLIISLLVLTPMLKPVGTVLAKLGDRSMNMWMIHSWFCYYLFHQFIYSFSYPIVILAVLTAISYVSSLLVNIIARPIELHLMSKAEVKAKPIL